MDTRKRLITSGQQMGKTLQAQEMERDFIIDHPDAVIVRYVDGQAIVEKPVQCTVVDVLALPVGDSKSG